MFAANPVVVSRCHTSRYRCPNSISTTCHAKSGQLPFQAGGRDDKRPRRDGAPPFSGLYIYVLQAAVSAVALSLRRRSSVWHAGVENQ